MKRFTDAIRKCLDNENWYGAIALSLIMPDICGSIDYPNEHPGKRYKQWFDDHLAHYYRDEETTIDGEVATFMSASDCWALRCSVLHAGTDNVTQQDAEKALQKFYFRLQGAHIARIDNKLVLDVARFSEEVMKAVEKWSKDVEGNVDAQNAIQQLLTIHTGAIRPSPGIRIK